MNDTWTIFEPKSGRYFKATFDSIMETASSLNKRLETDALKWNDIFRAFWLPTLAFGGLPFEYDRVSSHLDFSMDSDSFAPVVVIDYIKNKEP